MRHHAATVLFALLGGFNLSAHAGSMSVELAGDTGSWRPVTATPLDPTSVPQDSLFGGQRFSARALAVDIIVNGWRSRQRGIDQFGQPLFVRERAPTRWRLRASMNRVMLRYEISF